MINKGKIAVIGAGFSGLSAAAYLAAAGFEVDVYEKHSGPGGRARQLSAAGYTFDMGPSWYWMPDIFQRFFHDMGSHVSDWYKLKLLDPAFELVFAGDQRMVVPDDFAALTRLFESTEPGAGVRLQDFMRLARLKYKHAMESIIYKPGLSVMEFLDRGLLAAASHFQLFSSVRRQVRRQFRHPHLVALLEFPILFLGAMPENTPALYTLMNYAGLRLGTWYPEGGFGAVARAIAGVAEKKGAIIFYDSEVTRIEAKNNRACAVEVDGRSIPYDAVVAAADYAYVEEILLPPKYRNYSERYWEKKVFAPSCLIFYLGLSKQFPQLGHHTLFFEEDLTIHATEIYKDPSWPSKPLFYVCRTSASDDTVAPPGHDNLFLLMPIAPGLKDSSARRELYFEMITARLQLRIGEDIRPYIDYKHSYCISDFINDYGAYKGNAYGLANTLRQTAIFKPRIRNRKLPNLVYAGQLTVPGPGVPPALISGRIAADQLMRFFRR